MWVIEYLCVKLWSMSCRVRNVCDSGVNAPFIALLIVLNGRHLKINAHHFMWTTWGCHDNRACFHVKEGQLSLCQGGEREMENGGWRRDGSRGHHRKWGEEGVIWWNDEWKRRGINISIDYRHWTLNPWCLKGQRVHKKYPRGDQERINYDYSQYPISLQNTNLQLTTKCSNHS